MEIREQREELVSHMVTVGWKCDCCGLELPGTDYDVPDGWHKFCSTNQLYDDCLEWYDICSVSCYAKKIESILNDLGEIMGFEVDEMSYSFAKKLVGALK